MTGRPASQIQGLGELIRLASADGSAPVDQWDPPYCGDIGLKIDARGGWHYQGSLIARPPLVKLFARVLRCEKTAAHFLVTPVEKIDVAVADAPFLAVEMQVDGMGDQQTLTFRTNVDDIVVAGPDHPILFRQQEKSGGLKPYVRVRGRLYARLTRTLYFDLIELAEKPVTSNGDGLCVKSAGQSFALIPSDESKFFDFDV